MPKVKNQSNHSSLTGIGGIRYITQPSTHVAHSKGQVVVAPNFTYTRRFA